MSLMHILGERLKINKHPSQKFYWSVLKLNQRMYSEGKNKSKVESQEIKNKNTIQKFNKGKSWIKLINLLWG